MTARKEIPWPQIYVEGVAIVASILLAFWIQAWWEDRQHRNEERQVLTSLLEELQDLQEVFEDWAIHLPAIQESGRKILVASASADVDLTEEELVLLLADHTWFIAPTQIASPVMDSLVSAGDLSQLANAELRLSIAEFLGELRRVRMVVKGDFEFLGKDLHPFLWKRTSFIQLANTNAPRPGFPDEPYIFERIELDRPMSYLDLLESVEFQNLLLHREWILDNIVCCVDDTLNQLESLAAQVSGELEN